MEDHQPPGSVRYRELIEAEQYGWEGVPVARERVDLGSPDEASS